MVPVAPHPAAHPPPLDRLRAWRSRGPPPRQSSRPHEILPKLYLGAEADVRYIHPLRARTRCRLVVSVNGTRRSGPTMQLRCVPAVEGRGDASRLLLVDCPAVPFPGRSGAPPRGPDHAARVPGVAPPAVQGAASEPRVAAGPLPELNDGLEPLDQLLGWSDEAMGEMARTLLPRWWAHLQMLERGTHHGDRGPGASPPPPRPAHRHPDASEAAVPRGPFYVYHLTLHVADHPHADLGGTFSVSSAIIDYFHSALDAGVVIHCAAGISRSTTTLLAYLLYACATHQLFRPLSPREGTRPSRAAADASRPDDAPHAGERGPESTTPRKAVGPSPPYTPQAMVGALLTFVRERRCFAQPNPGFMDQLEGYSARLFGLDARRHESATSP